VIRCSGERGRQLQCISCSQAVDAEESLGYTPHVLRRLDFLPRPRQRLQPFEGSADLTCRRSFAFATRDRRNTFDFRTPPDDDLRIRFDSGPRSPARVLIDE
jgi:hypothetical protein